jgi:hypothetical protein
MYVMYYTLMFWCLQLVWILIKTNHPCLRVGCHSANTHGTTRLYDVKQSENTSRLNNRARAAQPSQFNTLVVPVHIAQFFHKSHQTD